ncbi:zinc finger protein 107-like [Argiope bruennichi]|uniref:zinc finger protein 107-like n=1 Tax=Argiope bruennichi TaxID=94029 RepID=UPI00249598CF|nr:zinc finger protein 107-like [Argiope bruennichi]
MWLKSFYSENISHFALIGCISSFLDASYNFKHRSGQFKEHKCHFCDYSSPFLTNVKHHIRKHTGERPFNCTLCCQNFMRKSQMKNHMITHSEERPYKCHICGKGFKRKDSIKPHMIICVLEILKFTDVFTVNTLSAVLVVPANVREKMANRRNLNHADIAKLMEASDSSEEVSEYKNHTSDEIESESSDNDFDTAIQQMNYKGNIQPKNHENMESYFNQKPLNYKLHKCSYCNYSSFILTNLKKHILIHTGERPFSCSICGKKFIQKTHLKRHMFIHSGTHILYH